MLFILPFITLALILFSGFRIIYEYEKALVFTLGKYSYSLSSGLKFIIPIIQTIEKVDLRIRTLDVAKQDCITKDNVSIEVDAVCYYSIVDIKKSILEVENYFYAIEQMTQTTLRNVVGGASLDELLASREKLAQRISSVIDEVVAKWGIEVSRVELKHVELPQEMKRMMAREAEAEREKRGMIIKAEGEVIVAQNLAIASKIIGESPVGIQLRTLQTISDIASEPSQKFVFFPTDIFQKMMPDQSTTKKDI